MKKTIILLQDGDDDTFAMLSFDESKDAVCEIAVADPEMFNENQRVILDEGQFFELFEAMAEIMRRFGCDPYEYLAPVQDEK